MFLFLGRIKKNNNRQILVSLESNFILNKHEILNYTIRRLEKHARLFGCKYFHFKRSLYLKTKKRISEKFLLTSWLKKYTQKNQPTTKVDFVLLTFTILLVLYTHNHIYLIYFRE